MKQTVKRFSLSFKNRVFFMCLLATLVPLLISSVVMVHIFTMSLNRQSEGTAKQQITEISERFSRLLEDCENTCAELTADGSAAWNLIDNTTIEIQKGMYLSLYQAVQEIYGHAQCSVYDAGGRLRFTTDTLPREGKLPVYWGLLRKASQNEGMTYYRTDPYLAVTNPSILMQGAYSLENPHGARTGYVVLDFTRDNFDNVFSGFYSLTDMILILDDHRKPVYCSRPDYSEAQISGIIAERCPAISVSPGTRAGILCDLMQPGADQRPGSPDDGHGSAGIILVESGFKPCDLRSPGAAYHQAGQPSG